MSAVIDERTRRRAQRQYLALLALIDAADDVNRDWLELGAKGLYSTYGISKRQRDELRALVRSLDRARKS